MVALDAVLLDYDGVVVELDEAAVAEAAAPFLDAFVDPPLEVVRQGFYQHPLMPAVDRGELPIEMVWDDLRPRAFRGDASAWSEWVGVVTDAYVVSDGMTALLDDLGPQVRLGLVTDNHRTFRTWLDQRPTLRDRFGIIACSAEQGYCKPDPRLFAFALEHLGSEPSRTAFVDDNPRNVEGARRLGMTGIHHTGDVAATRRSLLDHLGATT